MLAPEVSSYDSFSGYANKITGREEHLKQSGLRDQEELKLGLWHDAKPNLVDSH